MTAIVGRKRCKVMMVVVVVVVVMAVMALWLTAYGMRGQLVNRPSSGDICTDVLAAAKERTWWQSLTQQDWTEKWVEIMCRLENDMRQVQYHCKHRKWMGNKMVCFDDSLVPKNSCTVYSFGINYDFKFDDAMAGYGCTVYSFDPSMKDEDHRRSDRVFFKRMGVYSSDTDSFEPRLDIYVHTPTKWRVRRLSSIMKELGHPQGSLTILKLDIETTEWAVMEDILSEGSLLASIPQVLIEWHLFKDAPPRSRYGALADIFYGFRSSGFQLFHSNGALHDHKTLKSMYTQTETSWVNERFLASKRA